MPVYKFTLYRPNFWAELFLSLPSDITGVLVGAHFYYIAWFMPIVGFVIADNCFKIAYRYAFYRIAYDGSDQLNYPTWRFYTMTLIVQILLFSFIVMGVFLH